LAAIDGLACSLLQPGPWMMHGLVTSVRGTWRMGPHGPHLIDGRPDPHLMRCEV
jgi:hypothetical protein